LINIFVEYIKIYFIDQKWGQKEKACAFERKYARKILKRNLEKLNDKKKIEKVVEDEFAFIDFENKIMKNCGEKIAFLPNSREAFIKEVIIIQKKISNHSHSPERLVPL